LSLAHLLILALKQLALGVTANCTTIGISYEERFGSLLATDLTLWLLSAGIGNYTCYRAKSLVPKETPMRLGKAFVNITYSSMPKIKNIETLRIMGKWYYIYIGEPPSLKRVVEVLFKYDDLRAYFTFLALKYEYLKFLGKRIPLILSSCNQIVANYSDVSYKDAVAYALMTVNAPLRGGNLKLVVNTIMSYMAYTMYYDKNDIPFAKRLLMSVVRGSCTPEEALLLLLCKLSGEELWLCYGSIKMYLSLSR